MRRALIAACLLAAPVHASAQGPDEEASSARPRDAAGEEQGRSEEDAGEEDGEDERGQDGEDEGEQDRERGPSIPPRPIPDYGRPPDPDDAGEALLWIPRVIFYPVHLVFEYGLRIPLRWLFRTIELERLDALFAQGVPATERHEGAWWFVPLLRYDDGLQPSVGLAFLASDREQGHHLRVGVDLWGIEQLRGFARGSLAIDRSRIALALGGAYRNDRIFHGLGWDAPSSPRARYAHALGDAELSLASSLWRRSVLSVGARLAVHRFDGSSFRQDGDVSIDDAAAFGALSDPPGYPDGYTAVGPWARVVLDTRTNDAWPHASGVRAELTGAWAVNAERGPAESWARAGASLEIALEVMRDRTLRLRSLIELVEPLGERAVPFTEQASLGGPMARMPGFLPGRLLGLSAATLGLSWRYAIWSWMDAELFVDTGNVFGSLFDDFDVERLRLGFGTALLTRDPNDFALLVAFGTEPFVHGADLTSVRFAITVGAPL